MLEPFLGNQQHSVVTEGCITVRLARFDTIMHVKAKTCNHQLYLTIQSIARAQQRQLNGF